MLTVDIVSLVVFIYRPLIEAAVECNVRNVPRELRHDRQRCQRRTKGLFGLLESFVILYPQLPHNVV